MKNQELNRNVSEIIGTKNVVVEKSTISGNAINVYVEKPVFEDIGSFVYYENEANRDADYDELKRLIAENNAKAKN